MARISPCPNCDSRNLYKSKEVSAGGGYAPNYLPGLGGFMSTEKFNVILCRDCGLARLFARETAVERVSESPKWTRVD